MVLVRPDIDQEQLGHLRAILEMPLLSIVSFSHPFHLGPSRYFPHSVEAGLTAIVRVSVFPYLFLPHFPPHIFFFFTHNMLSEPAEVF